MLLPARAFTSVVALCLVSALPVAAQSRPQRVAIVPAYGSPAPAVGVDVAGPRYRFPRLRAAAAAALQRRFGVIPPQPAPAPGEPQQANRPTSEADERRGRGDGDEPTLAAASSNPLPDESDLRAMEDGQLVATLAGVSEQLHDQLGKLTTGEGWQRYLQLPEVANTMSRNAGPRTLDVDHLADTLERFDSVSAEEDYEMIATMPSFEATHAALRHVVRRVEISGPSEQGPLLTAPNGASSNRPVAYESLPTPEPDSPSDDPEGEERSVLKRTTRN